MMKKLMNYVLNLSKYAGQRFYFKKLTCQKFIIILDLIKIIIIKLQMLTKKSYQNDYDLTVIEDPRFCKIHLNYIMISQKF